MKTLTTLIVLISLLAIFPQLIKAKAQSGISVGARQHVMHSEFEELPFEDGDLTYTIGYEIHDKHGYWQILIGYTPEVGNEELEIGAPEVDYVITPQINLILQDGIFIAGTGILGSYIETEEDSDWTDVYWQLMLGIEIPLGAIRLELFASYVYESWGDIGDFDSDDIEFCGSLKYLF